MRAGGALFIVFEGIDGSGKTTLCDMAGAHFRSTGVPVVMLREPTGGRWGSLIREALRGVELPDPGRLVELFILDREDDVARNILPAIEAGSMILMDRYYYSNAAYQGAMGASPQGILEENRRRGFPEPDRVYLVDINVDEALRRVESRGGAPDAADLFERKGFLSSVREVYRGLVDDRFMVIDGSRPPEESLREIISDIEKLRTR